MPSVKHTSAADTSSAVDAFISAQREPTKTETELLRAAILGSTETISEGIKWNAPSYKTHEYFATTNLRTKTGIGLVLHFGAKVRNVEASRENIDDPTGLLKWVAKDRATLEFKDGKDIEAKRASLQAIVRQWVKYV
jgi:hypothetical protein